MEGKLYLIPATLGDSKIEAVIPESVKNIVNSINHYIVENQRTARRYLKKLGIKTSIDKLTFYTLNKHTLPDEINNFLQPVFQSKNVGIISEAGCPGIADPGSEIVKLAHQKNIRVIPLTGPSSIFLALMASGMNGQNFAFVGYLPIKKDEKLKRIRFLENRSFAENQTQIFMEAPYRNQHLLNDILKTCQNKTLLCLSVNITLEKEFIQTKTISDWKKNIPDINKMPTIFLLHKYSV